MALLVCLIARRQAVRLPMEKCRARPHWSAPDGPSIRLIQRDRPRSTRGGTRASRRALPVAQHPHVRVIPPNAPVLTDRCSTHGGCVKCRQRPSCVLSANLPLPGLRAQRYDFPGASEWRGVRQAEVADGLDTASARQHGSTVVNIEVCQFRTRPMTWQSST